VPEVAAGAVRLHYVERAGLVASDLVPNAGLQVYYGASHLLPMELPVELAALIHDFKAATG
jgi:hypothetical protein